MKTLLSIDFDVIMDSYLELYNDKESIPWEIRLNALPGLREMPVNSFHYEKITQLLLYILPIVKIQNVHFIKQHHSICKFLKADEQYNIINIDHHHDWYYREPYSPLKENLNCGNWINWAYQNGLVNSFTWIKNETSKLPEVEIKEINFSEFLLKDYDLNSLPKIDELYICLSPEFVPPYYYPLFFTWVNIYSTFYKKHFDFED